MPRARSHLEILRATAAEPSGSERIRVLLGVGHDRLRRSLFALLDAEPNLSVDGAVASWTELVAAVPRLRPHVLVVNLRAEHASMVTSVGLLTERFPKVEIVVLTMDPSAAVALRLIEAGARGLVLTERADSELPEAVSAAASARQFVSAPLKHRLEQLSS